MLALALPLACSAGRPVFEDLTLPALAARADGVIVATLVNSGEATNDEPGYPRRHWPLRVARMLKAPVAASRPARLQVLINVTAARDYRLRARRSTGAAFDAARYSPAAPPPRAGETRVVFAIASEGGLSLAAEQSLDSVRRIDEIERPLPQPHPTTPVR